MKFSPFEGKEDEMDEPVEELVRERSELAVEVAELWPPQGQWTEADYFALPDTNRLVELSEGRLIMPPLPTYSHQFTLLELSILLREFVKEHDLGTVCIAGLPVRLWPGKIREPDILYVSKEHADRIGEKYYGPPDLAVEIISPSTKLTDRKEKFYEYAQAGVQEYWLVDPESRTVEIFTLREGVYELLGRWGPGEVAKSALLNGFEVAINEIFTI
ncbi:MAG: Uma2 family endonuclease [Anaerolineae bacterium]